MRALVFPAGSEPYLTDLEPRLTVLNELVGGYIEAIHGPGWHAYVNEEGKWMGLPVNLPATQFAGANGWNPYGDHLVGTVVFLGSRGPDEDSVPLSLVDAAEQDYGPLAEQ